MKAILLFANGTEEVEALTPLDYLRRASVDTLFVGLSGREQTGSHGIKITADISLDELDAECDFDMLVIPGGLPGTTNIEASPKVQALISRAVKENKYLGAICAAPMIFGKLGLLSGKEAICYPGFEEYLSGAVISEKKAVRSGNIITARGAGAANEFALELISALCGEKKAEEIGKAVQFL